MGKLQVSIFGSVYRKQHQQFQILRYYASPDRIIILLTEVNNMMMNECSKALEPESMLQGEVDEGFKRVIKAEEILKYYRFVYICFKMLTISLL